MVRWGVGCLQWIPTALSTLKPTTSPHLSVIRIKLIGKTRRHLPRASLEQLDNDLKLIKHEIARIRREYVTQVDMTVDQHTRFQVSCPGSAVINPLQFHQY